MSPLRFTTLFVASTVTLACSAIEAPLFPRDYAVNEVLSSLDPLTLDLSLRNDPALTAVELPPLSVVGSYNAQALVDSALTEAELSKKEKFTLLRGGPFWTTYAHGGERTLGVWPEFYTKQELSMREKELALKFTLLKAKW